MIDKVTRIIFKRIWEDTHGRDIEMQEFLEQYLGQLIFLYVDTYGIPYKSAVDVLYDRKRLPGEVWP